MTDQELRFCRDIGGAVDASPFLSHERVHSSVVGLEAVGHDRRAKEGEHLIHVRSVRRIVEFFTGSRGFIFAQLGEYRFRGGVHASVDVSGKGLPAGALFVLGLKGPCQELD